MFSGTARQARGAVLGRDFEPNQSSPGARAMDVAKWLGEIGAGQYVADFRDNDIDASLLSSLTAEDLREIGVASVGHRRLILSAIAALAVTPPLAPDRSEPAEPPGVSPGQRRPVTVLFADLCGFTQLSGELEDESLHDIIVRYLAMADGVVKECGGVVDKHIGDAVMAVFGVPVAKPDDVANAARAALRIRDGMEEVSRVCGRPLQAHVGLAVGEAIVGGGAGAPHNAIGASVNLAARITSAAKPGEALVSDDVARQLSDLFRLRDRGTFAAKGVAEPVHVWSLIEESSGMRAARPFVGRHAELEQLGAVIGRCQTSGIGAIVQIRGEPGIGKTRLVSQMGELAQSRGFATAVTRVLEFGTGHARHPLRMLASALLGLVVRTGADAAGALELPPDLGLDVLGEALLLELVELELAEGQRSVLEAAPEERRIAERGAVLAGLAAWTARSRPLLLIVEDVHWADELLTGALLRLVSVAGARPLAIFITSRLESEAIQRGLREAAGYAQSLTVDLGPLRPDEAAEAATAFDVPEDVRRRCVERAAGHPLFLEQLLRNADELVRAELPASLRTLILARIDHLPDVDKRAIEAASTLGERFDLDAFLHVLGVWDFDLTGLVRAGMLRRSGKDIVFGHALIRAATDRSLLRETRQALHRRAAEWYADRDVILAAVHLKEAGAPEAAAAYRRAAEDRLERYRGLEALDLVDTALALASNAAERGELTLLKGSILLELGRARDALGAFQDALAMSLVANSECSALIGLASAQRILDDVPGALENVDKAQAIAARNDWLVLLSKCHHIRGNLLFPTGRVDACYAEHSAAVEAAEKSGDKDAIARALGGLGDAEYVRGRIISAGHLFRRCVQASVEAGLGRVEASNRPMAAFASYFELRLRDVLGEAEIAIRRAQLMMQPRAQLICLHMRAHANMELGEDAAALGDMGVARRITHELEAWRFEPENLSLIAEIHLRAGRRDEARAVLETAIGIARSTGMAYIGPLVLAHLARTEGDPAVRREILDEVETLLKTAISHNHWLGRRQLIELGWELRDPDLMEFHADALASYCKAELAPLLDCVSRRGRALARVLRGENSADLSAELARLKEAAANSGSVLLRRNLDG